MTLDVLGDNHYGFEHEGSYFKVSLLAPKMVFLYQDGQILQSFTRPESVYAETLAQYFKDDSTIRKNAIFGIAGTTNKQKFLSELSRLIAAGKIQEEARRPLEDFIRTTEFPPETIKKQLIIRGYGTIGDEMDFSEPTAALVQSCALFRVFLTRLEKLPQRKKHEFVQEHFQFPP